MERVRSETSHKILAVCCRAQGAANGEKMVVHASKLFELEVAKDALNADTFVDWEGCRRF